MAVQALMVLAIVVIYVSLGPDRLFIGWLFFAPLFQDYARHDRIGWILSSLVYVLPLGVMALHMLGSNTFARRLRWYDAVPFAYVMFVILSEAVIDASALRSFHFYIGLVYGGILVGVPLYYFCAFGPLSRLSASGVSAALLSSSSIVGAMAIAEHYTSWNLWGQHYGDHPARVVATLAQPAVLGAFVGVGVVVATTVLVWDGPEKLRRLSVVTLAATLPALYFTYTRGPILATFAVVVVLIVARPRMRLVAAGVAATAALVVALNWGQISGSSLYRTRGPGETVNVRTRLVLSEASLHLAAQRPILGWGYGQFDTVKNSESFNTGTLPSKQLYDYTSHDTYLTILVELGAVGLALFLLPLILVAAMTLRALRWTTTSKWFSISLLGVLGVVALTAFTTDMRFFSFVPALAWIAAGLLRRRLWDERSFA
jgi:O-antigen ligase